MSRTASVQSGPFPGRRWPWLHRHGWILVLVVSLALFEILRRALIDTGNPNYIPSLIVVGSGAIPTTFVAFLYGRRLKYDVPPSVLVVIALVGGVIGTVVAGVLEYHTLRQLGMLSMIGVALIEETAKLLLPAVVLATLVYRLPADGLVIGAASGAGFAVLETMGYAFVVLVVTGGNIDAVDGLLLQRGVLSPAAHMAWTGLTATALWMAYAANWSARSVLTFVATFVLAVALHATWDSIGQIWGYAVISAISLGALTWAAHRLAKTGHRTA